MTDSMTVTRLALVILAALVAPACAAGETSAPAPSLGHVSQIVAGSEARAARGDIRRAWLVAPTTRYAHSVLGDGIEGGGLMVEAGSRRITIHLPESEVFEDVAPRIHDLDGDGRNEIVVVRSGARTGGALAVYGLRGGALVPLAGTPPIGRANRWLNPAAIAGFDGDGIRDVALVETPHIGGELQLWSGASLLEGRPRRLAAARGFSNHAIGRPELDLTETVETSRGPVLVLPSADRRALVAVRFEAGAWRETGRHALRAEVTHGLSRQGDALIARRAGASERIPLYRLGL